jgi:hypothetical protein
VAGVRTAIDIDAPAIAARPELRDDPSPERGGVRLPVIQ